MDHDDHVKLLRPANLSPGGVWADLGAGRGAFTLALRELVGPGAHIYAVDRDHQALTSLSAAFEARFDSTANLHLIHADFMGPLKLPSLDGLVMANSLHFHRDHAAVISRAARLLSWYGVFLLVEYNVDRGNPWVPHPLSFEAYRQMALKAGLREPRLLATAPSSFLGEFYAALACKEIGGV